VKVSQDSRYVTLSDISLGLVAPAHLSIPGQRLCICETEPFCVSIDNCLASGFLSKIS